MNTISKFALSAAGVLLISGAAIAGDSIQAGPYGQGGAVSFYKPTARTTSVAVYQNGRGLGKVTAQEPVHRVFHSQSFGSFGDGAPVSYYSLSR